jgi:maltooligosyltrehalose synthase
MQRLGGDWRDTALEIPGGTWRNVLTGEQMTGPIGLANVLKRFPVALLERRA